MARTCDSCGKGTQRGNKMTRRGISKKKGGIGLRITSRTRRTFKANVQRVRVAENDGKTTVRKWLCASCIKRGKLLKRTRV